MKKRHQQFFQRSNYGNNLSQRAGIRMRNWPLDFLWWWYLWKDVLIGPNSQTNLIDWLIFYNCGVKIWFQFSAEEICLGLIFFQLFESTFWCILKLKFNGWRINSISFYFCFIHKLDFLGLNRIKNPFLQKWKITKHDESFWIFKPPWNNVRSSDSG